MKEGGDRKSPCLSFEFLFHLQLGDELLVSGLCSVGPDAPKDSEQTAGAGREMPEPARVAVMEQAAQRMIGGPDEGGAIERGCPRGNRRTFPHPIHRCLLLDAQEVNGGPTSLFHKAPPILDIIVVHASTAQAKPLPL